MSLKNSLASREDSSSKPAFNYSKSGPVPNSYSDVSLEKHHQDLFSMNCYECGANLTLDDKFCQNCENSTHDELMDIYRVAKKDFK